MYQHPGLSPVWVRRGDVREEKDVAARFQHQGREEESPDVSVSGVQGRYKVRQRQGGGETLPLITDPKGRRKGLISGISVRLARGVVVSRLHRYAADHRAVQAQIGKLAVGQARQFVDRLAVHAVTGKAGFGGFDQRAQPACVCALQRGGICCNSHVLYSVSCVCAGVVRRLLETENRQMLRLHNTGRRQCCYAANA